MKLCYFSMHPSADFANAMDVMKRDTRHSHNWLFLKSLKERHFICDGDLLFLF